MNYHLRKSPGEPIEGPYSVEAIRAMLDTEPGRANWQVTGDIGETKEQVKRTPADDWFPVGEMPAAEPVPTRPAASENGPLRPAPAKPPSYFTPKSPRTYPPEEILRLQDRCRQQRTNAEPRQRIAWVAFRVAFVLHIGCKIADDYATGSPGTAAALKTGSLYFGILMLVAFAGELLFRGVRCPGCGVSLPQNAPRDPRNDLCDICDLQLTPVTEEPAAMPRVCSDEEASRLQQSFATHRRKASAAHAVGFVLILAGSGLLIALAARNAGTVQGFDAMNVLLMLGCVIGWGLGHRLLFALWRVRCPACGETVLQNQKTARRFCHFCAQPMLESVKTNVFGRTFHYECSCRPDVSQGTGKDGLSHLCHCPHCGVKLN